MSAPFVRMSATRQIIVIFREPREPAGVFPIFFKYFDNVPRRSLIKQPQAIPFHRRGIKKIFLCGPMVCDMKSLDVGKLSVGISPIVRDTGTINQLVQAVS